MKTNAFLFTLGVLMLISYDVSAVRAQVAQEYEIKEVQVVGNQRVDTAAIKIQISKTSGRVSSANITEDVKNLYRTGFFEQVTANVVAVKDGNVLRYNVLEKPTVRKVFIRGNKDIDEKDLSDNFTFDSRRFFDVARVQALIKKAVAMCQARGYHDAAIEYSVVPVGENQVDLTFQVKEGARYKVGEVRIKGLKTIDEDELLAVIQTKRYKWWNSWIMGTGRLSQDVLDNDRTLMRQYFLDHGLIEATVSDPTIETDENHFIITFEAQEGPVYSVGDVTATGDLYEGNQKSTIEGIKSVRGKVFSATQLRDDAFFISEKFSDKGYAFANVVPNTNIDKRAHSVGVSFESSKGNQVKINRINIRGNEKTYDNVIRRELRVDEQELYSGSKVKRSQTLLQRTGYFEEASISQEPVGDDKVNLNVNVKEGSTGSFSAGAGFSTSDGALFNTRVSENNLFGTGRRATMNVDIGTQRDNYVLSLEDPRMFDSYFSGGVDIMRMDRIYDDFDKTMTGAAFTVGYPLEEIFGAWSEDIAASVKYEYLVVDITSVDPNDAAQLVVNSQGSSNASGITPRLTRNTINNPLNPTSGSRQDFSVELAGLGGDQEFYLLEGRNSLFYPLLGPEDGDLVFAWRLTVDYGESLTDEPFPLYKRFFPGGINSVRGYKARTLGPKDSNGHEYGGSKQLVNNTELIFPIVKSAGLKFVVFYDAGQSFDDPDPIQLGDLRKAYGAGIRWSSPVGPIRIEFGFPVAREEGESNMVTMFSFGAPM